MAEGTRKENGPKGEGSKGGGGEFQRHPFTPSSGEQQPAWWAPRCWQYCWNGGRNTM